MLCLSKKQSKRPSGHNHVDGTGRLQTVFREHSPRYYSLIERFGKAQAPLWC